MPFYFLPLTIAKLSAFENGPVYFGPPCNFGAKKSYDLNHKDLFCADYFVSKKSITNIYAVRKF